MKKILFILLILSSCTLEEPYIPDNRQDSLIQKEFVATNGVFERTTLNNDHTVDWKQGDKILYYSADNAAAGVYTIEEDCHSVHLIATISSEDTFFLAAYGAESLSDNTASGMTLNGAVKAQQTGLFENAHVSVAKASDLVAGQLSFVNLTSMIKFSLTRSDVSYVIFTTKDKTKIQGDGKVNVSYSSATPQASFPTGKGGNSIKVLTAGAGTYYISTLPCEFTGFDITYYNANGKCIGQTGSAKKVTLASDAILNLGTLDERVQSSSQTDLSLMGTANCYMVHEKGTYSFPTVKGHTASSVGAVDSVGVLWETVGTTVKPEIGYVIDPEVSYSNGVITFKTNDTFHEGNAVIAAYNSSGTILWSWHIWCTDVPSEQVYNNNVGTLMDRNLGATSATPGDVGAFGLLYQWGRKDPFLSGGVLKGEDRAVATIDFPTPVFNYDAYNTGLNGSTGEQWAGVRYAIEHPTTFIKARAGDGGWGNQDWYKWSNYAVDNTRWNEESDDTNNVYNPCPPGWTVPPGGFWSTACGLGTMNNDSKFDHTNRGDNFGNGFMGQDEMIWYPMGGSMDMENAYYSASGKGCYVWTCTGYAWSKIGDSWMCYSLSLYHDHDYVEGLQMYRNWDYVTFNQDYNRRGSAYSVRCMKKK